MSVRPSDGPRDCRVTSGRVPCTRFQLAAGPRLVLGPPGPLVSTTMTQERKQTTPAHRPPGLLPIKYSSHLNRYYALLAKRHEIHSRCSACKSVMITGHVDVTKRGRPVKFYNVCDRCGHTWELHIFS